MQRSCVRRKGVVLDVRERPVEFQLELWLKKSYRVSVVAHAVHFSRRGLGAKRMLSNVNCDIQGPYNQSFPSNLSLTIVVPNLSFAEFVFDTDNLAVASKKRLLVRANQKLFLLITHLLSMFFCTRRKYSRFVYGYCINCESVSVNLETLHVFRVQSRRFLSLLSNASYARSVLLSKCSTLSLVSVSQRRIKKRSEGTCT